jgi:formylglycine-generating enzyme required for sulfatase activity
MPKRGSIALVTALLGAFLAHLVIAEERTDYRPPAAADAKGVASSIVLIELPEGEFLMGSNNAGYQGGNPQHRVHVAAFRMAKYDITFDQFDVFARSTGRPLAPDEGWGRGDRPVINVDWFQIHGFIEWLNRGSGYHFRLPTEAEWEYAARAGTSTTYWWGDEPNSDYANTSVNRGRDIWPFTSPVGRFPANPFGLADMLGNVWQVVQDCRHLTYDGAPADGSAWLTGACDSRVARGGYFGSIRIGIRSFTRAAVGEHFHSMGLGFRVVADGK